MTKAFARSYTLPQLVLSVAVSGLLLAGTVALSGCQKAEPGLNGATKGGPTVATVNGEVITKNEYDQVYDFHARLMRVGSNPQAAANPVVEQVLKQMTLNQLILMALVEQEAEKRGITISDADLTAAYQKQEKLLGGTNALTQLLEKQGIKPEEFRQSLRQQLTVNKLADALAGESVAVSEQDVRSFYEEHKAQFAVPESIRASHILVKAVEPEIRNELQKTNPNITADELDAKVKAEMGQRKAKAETLLKQVKEDPKTFEQLASQQSDDPGASAQKGDLGMMTEQATDPAFWVAIQATPVGTLRPELVKSAFGYHIVRVHEKKDPHVLSFTEAKDRIEQELTQRKRTEFLADWMDQQQEKVNIKIEPAYQPLNAQQMQPGGPQQPGEKAGPKAPIQGQEKAAH